MKDLTSGTAVNPGQHSVTPPPGKEPSPETRARVEPEKEALKEALRQIQTPEQARKVVEAALAAAEQKTEKQVREQEAPAEEEPGQTISRVRDAATTLGPDKTAAILLEASREVAATSGENREALEEAFQEATDPKTTEKEDPSLHKPLALLRNELLTHMRPYQAIDARLFLFVNHLPHPPLANRFMYWITVIMNGGWGWIFGLVVAAIFSQRGRSALRQVVPPLWFATMTVEYPIKFYFRRRRPFIDVVQAISVGKKPGTFSFPSGHSAASFAGAWLMCKQYPHLAALWYTIASTVGFSRIYLGAHYPGDVVSGALTGTILAEVTRWMIEQSET